MVDAFHQVKILLENSPKLNDAILLSSRFNRIRKEIRTGIVDTEYADTTKQEITKGLLDLLQEIERQEERPEIQAEIAKALEIQNKFSIDGTILAKRDIVITINENHNHFDDKTIKHALTQPPSYPEVFLGRESELEKIHDILFSSDEHLLLLVNGRGGVGKTSLAAKYYHRYHEEYLHVAWVLKEKSIAQALMLLAAPLGIRVEIEENEKLNLVLTAMANLKKPCLLVIDNANELEDLEKHYDYLRTCSNFHLLLTTRITNFRSAQKYRIEGLPEQEALELFRRHYPSLKKEDEELVQSVREAVYCNTLVLELLAKNLKSINEFEEDYKLTDLLDDLQKKGLLKLSQSEDVSTEYIFSPKDKLENIISAMYDLAELQKEEVVLLSVFAVLPAESIGFKILRTLLRDASISDSKNWLKKVYSKGWVDFNKKENSFKCSPVIQEIVSNKNPTLRNDIEGLIHALIENLEYEETQLTNSTFDEASLYTHYAEKVLARFINEPDHLMGVLCDRIATYHTITGNLSQALPYFVTYNEINLTLAVAEPDSPSAKNNVAISYSKLGEVHTSLEDWEKALYFYKKDLQLTNELLESEPLNDSFKNTLAISYFNLGEVYTSLGRWKKALSSYGEDLQLTNGLLESDPLNDSLKNRLAISYSKIGETYTSLGDLEKALPFYKQYNLLELELHKEYPQTVDYKINLGWSNQFIGNTYFEIGELDQAIVFYEEMHQMFGELYEANPENISTKNGLAISYEKLGNTHNLLGNLDHALTFFEKEARLFEQLHEAYPQNADFKNGLAISYLSLGYFYEENLLKENKEKNYYLRAKNYWDDLVVQFPSYIEYKNNLDWVNTRLTEIA